MWSCTKHGSVLAPHWDPPVPCQCASGTAHGATCMDRGRGQRGCWWEAGGVSGVATGRGLRRDPPRRSPCHGQRHIPLEQVAPERVQRQDWYDAGKDGFIDLMELKLMMEKLGAPQTHLGLKNMIKEVDEDLDSKLSFREFLLIFRKAAAGELQEDSGLHALARLSEIDVSTEGVKGAKNFFEAKAQAINEASRFEEEIRAEQEEKKKQAEELKQRKAAFKELQSTFTQ
ncbi:EF-hand domain-containing protein D2 isoform X1 [Corapipo altera]|uniref:EF-hand domain-containing protein D2 isoform X1 n=1 Tax=Corapipo altera TaxID=415028 RepID=UPI000FD6626D|nr:EF-hand domain-containing protein D2 isoform X1 [Corapipo altera]